MPPSRARSTTARFASARTWRSSRRTSPGFAARSIASPSTAAPRRCTSRCCCSTSAPAMRSSPPPARSWPRAGPFPTSAPSRSMWTSMTRRSTWTRSWSNAPSRRAPRRSCPSISTAIRSTWTRCWRSAASTICRWSKMRPRRTARNTAARSSARSARCPASAFIPARTSAPTAKAARW